MRKTVIQLRETAARACARRRPRGWPNPHLINKAMLAELEALRATRLTEMAEMDEILAALNPLMRRLQHA